MLKSELSTFNNDWYEPGSGFKRTVWFFINAIFFNTGIFPFSGPKVYLLKMFGAKVGKGVFIKPSVNIKYPWFLEIGNYVWIGENVWIDNLTNIHIGNNVCVSQGAMLLTGNHNYKLQSFDLIVGKIILEEGVWIGAKSIVCPGITCASHSILSVGSIATKNMEPYCIYQGNPAVLIKKREINKNI